MELRQQGYDPDWPTSATFDLHRQRNQRRTRGRDLLQVGHVLQSVNVRSIENLVGNKVPGRTIIEAGRIQSHARDFTPDQELGCLFRDPRKMQVGRVAGGIRASVLLLVRPEAPPAGVNKSDAAFLYGAVALLPRGEIFGSESVIGIAGALGGYVYNDDRCH